MTHLQRRRFYARGKLLIAGEYAVLDGALAFALPLQFGQAMIVERSETGDDLFWKGLDYDRKQWFSARFKGKDIALQATSDEAVAQRLQSILKAAQALHPSFLTSGSHAVTTSLQFPRTWGWGSSSTVITCIAQWSGTNPFDIQRMSIGGSGYDIACAMSDHPIFYQLENGDPIIHTTPFNPPFKKKIYFIYLNKKQSTAEAIKAYREKKHDSKDIQRISNISKMIAATQDFAAFQDLITQHEGIISNMLNRSPVQQELFSDYWGSIKSLGAWGGDYIMATSNRSATETQKYFMRKGLNVVIPYENIVL